MSDIPEHIWEAARSLRNAVCWQSNASVEPIASALLAAEQRGREEAKHQASIDVINAVMAYLSQKLCEEGIE